MLLLILGVVSFAVKLFLYLREKFGNSSHSTAEFYPCQLMWVKKKKKKKQNTIPINANHTIARQNVKTLSKGHCYEKNIYTYIVRFCFYLHES